MYTEIYGALVSHTGFSASEILTKIQHPLNCFGVESVQLFLMSTEKTSQQEKLRNWSSFLFCTFKFSEFFKLSKVKRFY